ncbi:MAG: Ig-like domain-containing protein [Acutalibacteraceae bacterium]|nr:Ig-like domain-containing protein [Acutalibacteraceae bacterium]
MNPVNLVDTYTWTSSDESVATVNKFGNVTAVGVGTATITVTSSNGKTATCTVVVK